MIDLEPVFTKMGYKSESDFWIDLYVTQGLSISQLIIRLGISRNTIRARLEKHGIPIRSRGGANNQKLEITDELINEIRDEGITPVAKRLGLSYTTIYKRLYRARGIADEPKEG